MENDAKMEQTWEPKSIKIKKKHKKNIPKSMLKIDAEKGWAKRSKDAFFSILSDF